MIEVESTQSFKITLKLTPLQAAALKELVQNDLLYQGSQEPAEVSTMRREIFTALQKVGVE